MRNTLVRSILVLTVAGVLATTGCAPSVEQGAAPGGGSGAVEDAVQYDSAQAIADSYDITELCGDDPVTIGYSMSVGVSWYLSVGKMLEKEAAKCPNVTIQTVDAQGDPQKAASDVNSLVAQGADGIISYVNWQAQLPAFRQAVGQGVPVVPFISDAGGVIGTDFSDAVYLDTAANGETWAAWLDDVVGEGKVAFLAGGEPGNKSALANYNALRTSLEEYPGLTLVDDTEESIPWARNDPAEMRRVTAGLLAQHGQVDAIVTDYGAITGQAVDAFEAAGLALPAVAVSATTNGMNCQAQEQGFPFYSTDGSQAVAFVALRKLLAAVNGLDDPEPGLVKPFPHVDTQAGLAPKCDPDASPDIDWSTNLSDDELDEIFD